MKIKGAKRTEKQQERARLGEDKSSLVSFPPTHTDALQLPF